MSDKKVETHILKMEHPKDIQELCHQLRHVVNHFYESAEGAPIAPLIRALLAGDGPIWCLCKAMSEQWGADPYQVSCEAISSIGIAARIRECQYMQDKLGEVYPTEEWVKDHPRELSWTILCAKLDEVGLGCSCAFCTAAYVASQYRGEPSCLKRLFDDLCAIEEDDEERCASTLLDKLMARYGWEHIRGGFQDLRGGRA